MARMFNFLHILLLVLGLCEVFLFCCDCLIGCTRILYNMEFTKTTKGKDCLIYENYMFHINGKNEDTVYWECKGKRRQNCRATAISVGTKICVNGSHTCDQTAIKTGTHVFKESCKDISFSSSLPLPRIYREEANRLAVSCGKSDAILRELPLFKSTSSSMYRAKHKSLPTLAKTRREIVIPARLQYTPNLQEKFLLADIGTDDKILIFATEKNLEYLTEAHTLFCDGTFKHVPKLFYQLYSIHGKLKDLKGSYPLVYALLPNKQKSTYASVLEELRRHLKKPLQCEK